MCFVLNLQQDLLRFLLLCRYRDRCLDGPWEVQLDIAALVFVDPTLSSLVSRNI